MITSITGALSRKVSDAQIPNDVRVEDATLVSLVNSAAVADRLASYYACRSVINLDMTLRREKPGEVVQIVDPYDKRMVTAAISSSEEDVSSVVKASVSALVGFSPAQFGSSEYYDERVVLTGKGTWTPPEGAVSVTAVLIGAGDGGASGMMGKAPTPGKVSSESNSQWNNRAQIKETGAGGEGGLPGEGGKGGKVLQVTIDLSGVSSLAYSCGVGGTGGKASRDRTLAEEADKSAPGSAGTDTTFGSYSSASGSSSPAGYYDPITKEIFVADGSAGVAGGKGGGLATEDDKHSQAPGPDVVYEGVAYHGGASHEAIKTAEASTSFVAEWHDSWTQLAAMEINNCRLRAVAGNQKCWSMEIKSYNASVITIAAFKLEMGPVQTLAHRDASGKWVLNDPPPNETLELAKCQRYQYVPTYKTSYSGVIGFGGTSTGGHIQVSVPHPVVIEK